MQFDFPDASVIEYLKESTTKCLIESKRDYKGTLYYHKESIAKADLIIEEHDGIQHAAALGVSWQWGAVLYFQCESAIGLEENLDQQLKDDFLVSKKLHSLAEETNLEYLHFAKNHFAFYPKQLKPLLECLKPAMVLFDLKPQLSVDLQFVYEIVTRWLKGNPSMVTMKRLYNMYFMNKFYNNHCSVVGIFENRQVPTEKTWLSDEIEKITADSWLTIAFPFSVAEDEALLWVKEELLE